MSNLLVYNAEIVTPTGVIARGWLLAREGRIAALEPGDAPTFEGAQVHDAQGRLLLPGFIDVHVHGALGHDAMDASADGLRAMACFYAQHGVTAFLPTTLTGSRERITAALRTIKALVGQDTGGAQIVGAHLEGPYLNVGKSGAQQTEYIRRVDSDEALEWLNLGVVRLVSLAPEFEENHWLIGECVRRGVTVSAAHTDATYDQTRFGITLGITHSTHTFNAMRGLHHRDPGTLGAVLEADSVRCELIADNIHVHPGAMRLLYKLKGVERTILISDAVRAAGMPDGAYTLGEYGVTLREGTVTLADGTLAGSALTMDRAVANFVSATQISKADLWRVCSYNAAQAIGVDARKGSLEVGKDADLVLLDGQFQVKMTVVGGKVAHVVS